MADTTYARRGQANPLELFDSALLSAEFCLNVLQEFIYNFAKTVGLNVSSNGSSSDLGTR